VFFFNLIQKHMKTKFPIIFSAIIFSISFQITINSFAQDGSLDLGFGVNGKVTTAIGSGNDAGYSVAMQQDGKIVVAGNSTNGSNIDFALVRYNSNGTPDPSFGTNGIIITDFGSNYDDCQSVAIQSDGKIVAAGMSHNGINWDFAIARYNTDGTPDIGFGTNGKLTTDFANDNDVGFSMALQSDGKIVVTGYSQNSSFPYDYDFALARYNGNGSPDLSFGINGKVTTPIGTNNDTPRSVAIQNDGKIVVAGYSIIDGDMFFAVARYNNDGTLDSGFGNDGKLTTTFGNDGDYALSTALQPDGKIVVAGLSYNWNTGLNRDIALARYNNDGSLDPGFGSGGLITTAFGIEDEEAFSVAIQSDGKILAAGYSENSNNSDFAMVRYLADGTLDPGFGTGGKITTAIGSGFDEGHSLAIQDDGKIVLAGISFNGANNDFAVVRYNNSIATGTQNLPGGDVSVDLYPNPANEMLVVKANANIIGSNYIICNSLGKTEITGKLTSEATSIDIGELSGGIYFILVKGWNHQTFKFIKE
jgi:uncharacterized delta-60 repeat protein